jgi:hypothetical protein
VSDIQAPADPYEARRLRVAKLAVIVLSALIILAMIGLVVGIVVKSSSRAKTSGGGGEIGVTFVLPPDAQIVSTAADSGRLILHVRSAKGDEVDIFNTDDGHLIARIGSAPKPARP